MASPDNVPNQPAPSSLNSSVRKTRLIVALAVLAALAAGFAAGSAFVRHQQDQMADAIIKTVVNRDGPGMAVDFNLFWQVWDRLHENFVDKDKLDAQELVYGAISGMVDAAGDPYTVFMEPETTRKFQEEVSGAFGGVGMELGKRGGLITVIAPIKDTPAYRAGILAGDVILEIDAKSTDDMTVEEAVSLIRGKKGTAVVLQIGRAGESEPREFTLVRDTIRIPAVEWKMLDGKVAYLQIFSFSGNVDEEFAKAGKEIQAAGATRIIVDVRNNPGGFLDAAVDISGWFLPSDSVVVQEKFSDGHIEELRSAGGTQFMRIPTVVLINGGSASASEIMAGALHDIRDLPLVGEKTFGKGSVQQIEGFYNGSSLKVTIAKWLTPKGVSISDTGIEPTVKVEMDFAQFEEKGWEFGTPGKDPQLDRALEVVRGL